MIREKTIFRNFLFGAVLLAGTALAVSCSVDEAYSVSDENAISFKSVVATRATATTVNNLNEFTVWGWKVDSEGKGLGTLINGADAANDGTGTYATDRTYYWPGCAVDFLGISPLAATVDDTNGKVYIGEAVAQTEMGESGVETFEGYFVEAENDPEGRINALTVHVPADAADQADLLYAYTPSKSTGKVPMNFRHALAQVEFKALNTNSWLDVEIAGVKVASVANHGELALPTETTSATDGAYGTWTPAAVYNGTEYAAGVSGTVTLGSDATALNAEDGALFLIPQEVEAWVPTDADNSAAGAYFLISCRISELGVELWPGDGTFAEVAVPCDIDWKQGKKYTYTFFFGEGAGYYPPTSETTPGDAILNGPIAFTVDVTDLDGSTVDMGDDTADNYIVVKTYEELDAAVEGDWHYIIVEGNIDIGAANGHGFGIYTDTVIIIEDGYTITAPNSGGNAPYAAFYLEYINAGRGTPNLTIDGDGTIATTGDSAAANTCCIYVREGELTINSGTFKGGAWNVEDYTGTDYCIYGYGYSGDVNVTINGGSFQTGSHTADFYANPDPGPWESVIDPSTGGTVVQHPDGYVPYGINFTVNAGKFYMYDPSSYVSSGSTVSQDGDGWYVVKH